MLKSSPMAGIINIKLRGTDDDGSSLCIRKKRGKKQPPVRKKAGDRVKYKEGASDAPVLALVFLTAQISMI